MKEQGSASAFDSPDPGADLACCEMRWVPGPRLELTYHHGTTLTAVSKILPSHRIGPERFSADFTEHGAMTWCMCLCVLTSPLHLQAQEGEHRISNSPSMV